MEKLMMDCEIITPLFSSGIDPKKAELRTSELKALMRYVYRIASNTLETKELYKEEARLFGDAENHASPIRLQLVGKNLEPDKNVPLLLHKGFPKSKCFPVGRTFSIVLRKFLNKGESLQFYQNLIILSLILCGLGKRSRRGRGCSVVDAGESVPHLTRETLLPWIADQLNLINEQTTVTDHETYIFDNHKIKVHPKAYKNWSEHNRPVIEEIRVGKPIDDIKDFLTRVDLASHKIKKKYASREKLFATGYADGRGRFASSLIISVTRTSDEKLFPVYTFVKAVVGDRPLDSDYKERYEMVKSINEMVKSIEKKG